MDSGELSALPCAKNLTQSLIEASLTKQYSANHMGKKTVRKLTQIIKDFELLVCALLSPTEVGRQQRPLNR